MAPLSYAEMIVGHLSVVVLRATATGIGIMVMGLFFNATRVESWPLFVFWLVSVSAVFGLLGIIVGLWSKSFEQLNMPVVFFLTPLSMVGGVFNTAAMLPDWLRWMAWGNPFFYFINGLRGAMIGVDETPARTWCRTDDCVPGRAWRHHLAAVFQGLWPQRVRPGSPPATHAPRALGFECQAPNRYLRSTHHTNARFA